MTEHEATSVARALAGDTAARNEIIMSFWPFIVKSARTLSGRTGVPADDLAQVAATKVLEEFGRFGADKGTRPISYFGVIAVRAMQKYCHTDGGIIRLPPRWSMPNPVNVERGEKARDMAGLSSLGGEEDFLVDMSANSPDAAAATRERIHILKEAINKLEPTERIVIRMRMTGLSLSAIGRVLGRSKERVRQIESDAHAAIRLVFGVTANSLAAKLTSRLCAGETIGADTASLLRKLLGKLAARANQRSNI